VTKHNFRLLSSGFWVDVRLRQIRGRWIASADTPDGPSVGVSWFPQKPCGRHCNRSMAWSTS